MAQVFDFVNQFGIIRGDDWKSKVHILESLPNGESQPKDLTGYSCRLQARVSPNHPPVFTLESPSDIDPLSSNGVIQWHLKSTDSKNIRPGRYHYQLQIISNPEGVVTTVLYGTIQIIPDFNYG